MEKIKVEKAEDTDNFELKLPKDDIRNITMLNMKLELDKLVNSYMNIYDEYYSDGSRNSAFLKDLADAILGISAVLEVYARDKKIYARYALEKLNFSKSYIDSCISYFENKLESESSGE